MLVKGGKTESEAQEILKVISIDLILACVHLYVYQLSRSKFIRSYCSYLLICWIFKTCSIYRLISIPYSHFIFLNLVSRIRMIKYFLYQIPLFLDLYLVCQLCGELKSKRKMSFFFNSLVSTTKTSWVVSSGILCFQNRGDLTPLSC